LSFVKAFLDIVHNFAKLDVRGIKMSAQSRKERRLRMPVHVTCSCRDPKECIDCDVVGMSINTSTSGMCIYTLARFEKGIHLNVECKYNGFVRKNAIVKWCKEIVDEELYKIGIAFD
jgi:hypothetical protein